MSALIRQKNKTRRGFTLIELMVAIAVFSMVMVVAMSALLNVIDADLKAQAVKTAINNVNFALESISKDMRVGTGYTCVELDGNACTEISYIKKDENDDDIVISYKFVPQAGTVKGRIQKEKGDGTGFQDITSQEVNITRARFYILTDDLSTPEKTQPRMVMTLSGEAGTKERIKTTFDLQTSVSQRTRL